MSNTINQLTEILRIHKNKRIILIGTTCTGKSSFLKKIKDAQDMDDLIFPLLTKKEEEIVCQTPWTPKIGKIMTKLVKEKVKVKKGHPLFGTVVLDCEVIIYLHISDKLLKERTKKRNVSFIDAKNMQEQIEKDIQKSNLPFVTFSVG